MQPVFVTGSHSSGGGATHCPKLQVFGKAHEPHEPPHPSEPHCLPPQLGTHGGLHVPLWQVIPFPQSELARQRYPWKPGLALHWSEKPAGATQ
jgi:hypothetical protein